MQLSQSMFRMCMVSVWVAKLHDCINQIYHFLNGPHILLILFIVFFNVNTYFTLHRKQDLFSRKPSSTSPLSTFATPAGVPVKITSPFFKVKNVLT